MCMALRQVKALVQEQHGWVEGRGYGRRERLALLESPSWSSLNQRREKNSGYVSLDTVLECAAYLAANVLELSEGCFAKSQPVITL